MCGITGFSGGNPAKIDKLKLLLAYNEDRGKDSCGIYLSNKDVKSPAVDRITKKLGAVKTVLLPEYEFTNDITTFIGHTRQKTTGAVSVANAHPFYFKAPNGAYEIIGCHNGIVGNTEALMEKYEWKNTDWQVDSELIFKGLAEHDDYRILKDMGYRMFALLWVKIEVINGERKETMYAFRKEDRTLFFGFLTTRETENQEMYISSTEESLKAIGCFDIEAFKPDTLYKIEEGYSMDEVAIKCEPLFRTTTTTSTPYSGRSMGPANNGTNSSVGNTLQFTDDFEEDVAVEFVRSRFLGDKTDTEELIKRMEAMGVLDSLTDISGLHADHDLIDSFIDTEDLEVKEVKEPALVFEDDEAYPQARLELARAVIKNEKKRQAEEDGIHYEVDNIEIVEEDDIEETDLGLVPSMIELVSSIRGKLSGIGETLQRNLHRSDLANTVNDQLEELQEVEKHLLEQEENLEAVNYKGHEHAF